MEWWEVLWDWILWLIVTIRPWLSTIGAILLFVGTTIGLTNKIRKFMRTTKLTEDERKKEKYANEIMKVLGLGELMDILIILNDLLAIIPSEELVGLIIQFKEKYDIEQDMKESMDSLTSLLTVEKKIISKPIHELLQQYRERKQTAPIMNKKKWNRLKKDKAARSAVKDILKKHGEERLKRAKEVRRKGRVDEISEKIKAITSEENIAKNRRNRFAIELRKEKKQYEEETKKKKIIQEELFHLFK